MSSPSRHERVVSALSYTLGLCNSIEADGLVVMLRDGSGNAHLVAVGPDEMVNDLAARGFLHLYPEQQFAHG